MRKRISVPPRLWAFLFFGVLLFARAGQPTVMVFDEAHYVPAARELALLSKNLNWVHPPLAKFLMGLSWLIFTKTLGWLAELTSMRAISIVFGLWALAGVGEWMRELRMSREARVAATWLTGFNFLWFVQSKTAMLDMFFVAFAVWGLLDVYRNKPRGRSWWRGWIFLGLAMACKWAAAPFVALGALWSWPRRKSRVVLGLVLSGIAYVAAFAPMSLLQQDAVPFSLSGLVAAHQTMLNGFGTVNNQPHNYASHWWQWPTLLRPMWYTFETEPNGLQRSVWAGGNPVLFWTALPALFWIVVRAFKRRARPEDKAARELALLYWVPLLFWAVAPRKLQMFYYYVPSSLWVGPIVAWAADRLFLPQRLIWSFVLLCAVVFLYFLPVMDGRALPAGQFYQYMWLPSWI